MNNLQAGLKAACVVMLPILAFLSNGCSRELPKNDATASAEKEKPQPQAEKASSEPVKKLYPYHPIISDYINKVEVELAAENVKTAKKNADDFQYGLSYHDIAFIADLNGDKLEDVVLKLYTCEVSNCHNTTGSNDIAVFLNKGNTYELVATKSLGMAVDNITSFYDYDKNVSMIQVDTLDYGDSDPTCCPSLKKSQKYKLSGTELVLVK